MHYHPNIHNAFVKKKKKFFLKLQVLGEGDGGVHAGCKMISKEQTRGVPLICPLASAPRPVITTALHGRVEITL